MPLYEYECQNCGKVFEELVFTSSTPDEEIICPYCGEHRARKMISAPSIGGRAAGDSSGTHSCGSGGFT